jgi:hypothetical protein
MGQRPGKRVPERYCRPTACLIWTARFGRIRSNTRRPGYCEIRFPPELPIGLGASITGLKQAVGLRTSFEAAFPGALPQAGMRDAFGVKLAGASRNVQTPAAGILPAVEGGILPPGPKLEVFDLMPTRAAIPPGKMPGSTAGRDACLYGAGRWECLDTPIRLGTVPASLTSATATAKLGARCQ